MQTVTNQPAALPATSAAQNLQAFAPLEKITRPTVTTEEVAFHLNRKPQTHRSSASCEPKGAIKPLRIVGLVCLAVILVLLSGDAK